MTFSEAIGADTCDDCASDAYVAVPLDLRIDQWRPLCRHHYAQLASGGAA